jgi:cobalt-zinc-cadmium efflux system protein
MPHDTHDHDHSSEHHHTHDHHSASHLTKKALILAISINGLLTIAQVIGGIAANSLALMTDALHNASDALALVLALIAIIIGERPADKIKSFGYKRAESVTALINLTALIMIGLFLAGKSITNLITPEEVHAPIMIWVAAVALVIDTGTALLLRTHACDSDNMRAAFLHNVMDALASLAVILGGVAIFYGGGYWIDPALSLMISVYVIIHGYKAMQSTIHLLMEGTPKHIDHAALSAAIADEDNITDIHHIHIWQINENATALEAHIVITDLTLMEDTKSRVKALLVERFGISHSTLEFEDQEISDECLSHKC